MHQQALTPKAVLLGVTVLVLPVSGCFNDSEDEPIAFILGRFNDTNHDLVMDFRQTPSRNAFSLPPTAADSEGGGLSIPCGSFNPREPNATISVYRGSKFDEANRVAGPQNWADLRCPAEYHFRLHKDFSMSLTLVRAAKTSYWES